MMCPERRLLPVGVFSLSAFMNCVTKIATQKVKHEVELGNRIVSDYNFGGLSIGMEVMAFINDRHWNSMVDNIKERFSFQEFVKCKMYTENGTAYMPNETDYDNLFQRRHRRDLPFERIFLELMCTSFIMYMIVMNIYIGWKNVMTNIYISIVSNLIGMLLHMASFGLILSSTLMYTETKKSLLASKSCDHFHCFSPSCSESDFRDRAKERHDETRACMEKLHICQLDGFKDRVVFLVLGCIAASSVALVSSCRRLRRRRTRRITPHMSKAPVLKKSMPQPSMENVKTSSHVPANEGSTDSSSSNDS